MEVVLYGADSGPFAGAEGTHPFARSLPLEKALDDDTLLAWGMNGEPLPDAHGAPLRAVVPGWYAMDSVKWLTRIDVVTEPFRGPFQELDYRFLEEGDPLPGRRLTTTPIHSLILSPVDATAVAPGTVTVRGIAWGGSGGAASVELRLEDGEWRPARLLPATSPFGHAAWAAEYEAPAREHQLSVRATDGAGASQPERPVWNRRGYANNSIHRVRVLPA
jgi:DMSO/TMAO reductase YedYZ molybdopterin-dependent catalytic subunit